MSNRNGIDPASMNFHAVHRVGKKEPSPTNSTGKVSPRQVIVRFISRNDRDIVWENWEKLRIPLTSCSRKHFLYPISRKKTQRSDINYVRQLEGPEKKIK